MSHTPGPWRFDKEYGNSMDELYGPDGRAIAAIWTRRCHHPTHTRQCYKPCAEGQANARLIAAAPEGHEIMMAIHEFFRHYNPANPSALALDGERTLKEAVADYIAKATGQ